MEYLRDGVSLTVEDFTGSPDQPAPAAAIENSGGGYGLTGMRERAELLGGTLTAGPDWMRFSRRASGTCVTEPRIRVLAVDDQRVVREGLAMLLGLLPDVEVVGTAADGEEALALAGELRPDVILMDLRMPRVDGVEATRRLRASHPEIKVVVLTTYADDRSVIDALRAGALGYLTKDAGADEIRQALQRVASGQASVDPAVQMHLVEAIATTATAAPNTPRQTCSGAPRWPHAPRSRGTRTHRGGPVEYRDRGPAVRQRGHGEESRQPHAAQDRRPRPGAGGGLRLPARTRPSRPRPPVAPIRSSTPRPPVASTRSSTPRSAGSIDPFLHPPVRR